MWNIFKVNNKDTRTTTWRRSSVFIVNFEIYFTPSTSVSNVNFEQVNAGWDRAQKMGRKSAKDFASFTYNQNPLWSLSFMCVLFCEQWSM